MFDRILVPVDGTISATSALSAGKSLADRWSADLKILTLLRRGDRVLTIDEIVRRQVDRIVGDGTVDVRDVTYSVVDDIAAEFDEVDNTLVVMSTGARGRTGAVVGNVAEDVMRHIRKPMLLLGPAVQATDGWLQGPLMVCTDGSAFAESIVPIAAAWADDLDLEVTVLGNLDDAKIPAGVPVAVEANAVARTAGHLGSRADITVGWETLHGPDPADAIVDYARRSGAGVIAMATHGRSGWRRLRFGSVTMKVIADAPCPVLVNRPSADIDG